MANPLASENIWFGKYQCEDAERAYYERLSGVLPTPVAQCTQKNEKPANQKNEPPSSDLVNQIAKARQQIQKSLDNPESTSAAGGEIRDRIAKLEQDKNNLNKVTEDLQAMVKRLENRIASLECGSGAQGKKEESKAAPAPADDDEDDDDIDLFGSDSEDDAEAERLKEARVKQYQEKKSTKKAIIAKSSVVIDVKTWGDEVDMKEMEQMVRGIEMDGLVWGASKVLPVAFGVKKLQIIIVIEDDKVSTEDLQEQIEAFEDHVQSTDIVAFNKI